ncbi:DUF1648 domain-containing protein [Salisediminibacterium selenitireducens]|uniref:DUF1648 domain-containing protein n=1 Tax=Bacillus selenitireducens (strain ATCC 700615 / DSM 15326 / MLS10) TaxID=439292 RepID=D6XYV7_BACIE|nr:DUF1648 domain-containing protein [Salisediminibacterium selenitireducens]ADH98265.1 protein of unknown function DUF1648 [[Bacillus] selenitireducens MLS10]
MPSPRPKIPVQDLHQPAFLKFLSLFSILLYVTGGFFLLIMWPSLPDQIPAHFDATGAVTRLGSVWTLVALWITGAALFVFMHIMERFPHIHN